MAIPSIDLNADLGEAGPDDTSLLRLVSSANVACGFHAGSPRLMLDTCAAAAAAGVRVGAHPSYADREGFGRRELTVDARKLLADLVYQVGAFCAVAEAAGTRAAYVKLHGALYNRSAVDFSLAARVAAALGPRGLPLLAPPGSALAAAGRRAGLTVFSEGFADRAYAPDGTLVPRGQPGAVIEEPDAVAAQALALAEGRMRTTGNRTIEMRVDSICVHGDTPGALDLARAVRCALEGAGLAIRAFA